MQQKIGSILFFCEVSDATVASDMRLCKQTITFCKTKLTKNASLNYFMYTRVISEKVISKVCLLAQQKTGLFTNSTAVIKKVLAQKVVRIKAASFRDNNDDDTWLENLDTPYRGFLLNDLTRGLVFSTCWPGTVCYDF
jgi:hypothetical protein